MNQLLIFAKYPEPGKVKTRLARQVGAECAATLYEEMAEEVARKTIPKNNTYKRILYFDPPEKRTEFESWLSIDGYQPQEGNNLGERLTHAVSQSLKESEKIIVIGTDCVEFDHILIEESFQKLDTVDLVIGPAKDGGYYLIGFKKIYPELFQNIPWSTEQVFKETLKKAQALDLTTHLLPELSDIDEA